MSSPKNKLISAYTEKEVLEILAKILFEDKESPLYPASSDNKLLDELKVHRETKTGMKALAHWLRSTNGKLMKIKMVIKRLYNVADLPKNQTNARVLLYGWQLFNALLVAIRDGLDPRSDSPTYQALRENIL